MSSLNRRRDPLIVDTVQLAVDDVDEYTPVNRDGTVATANGDAYGVTMTSGNEGDHVPVTRLGFVPVMAASEALVDDEKVELIVGADGKLTAVTAAGDDAYVIAVSEEAASADGAQTGAWVDCLSPGRLRSYGS